MWSSVRRPVPGRGFTVTGHHEINIPLLAAAIFDALPGGGH